MREYYDKTDYKTIIYALVRIALGSYLLFHSIIGILDFDEFMVTALSYFADDSSISFLAYLTPIVPFMEFFLALMILTGLYTRIALQYAIGIGMFFMLFFHFTGDLNADLEHAYSVIVKVSLICLVYLNKYSLDYYNMWKVAKESSSIES
jgi:uncharacterized membrane protein YphA (DoxX/SURF4 family)